MSQIIPPSPVDSPFGSYNWDDWYEKVRRAINNSQGTITVAQGGTGITSYSVGDLIYASAAGILARRGIGATNDVLTVIGGLPVWQAPVTGVTSVTGSGNIASSGGTTPNITFTGVLPQANGGVGLITINAQTASYVLTATDCDPKTPTLVKMNVAGANTLTFPLNATVAIAIGSVVGWVQYGAGQTTLTPGTGAVNLRTSGSLTSRVQYSSGTATKIATDEWLIEGDTT